MYFVGPPKTITGGLMKTPIERRASLSGKRKEVTHRDTSKKTSCRVDYPYGNRALMRCVCGK